MPFLTYMKLLRKYSLVWQQVPRKAAEQEQRPFWGVPPLWQNLLQGWTCLLGPLHDAPPQEGFLVMALVLALVPELPHGWLHPPQPDQPPQVQLTALQRRRRRRRRHQPPSVSGESIMIHTATRTTEVFQPAMLRRVFPCLVCLRLVLCALTAA